MIRIFTKTRKRLLTENKFSKYLKYATGEIILIVIGLLFAIQINNWNEGRKQQKQVIHYLENFVLDLKKDHKSIELLYETYQFKVHSLQYLLKISGNKHFEITSNMKVIDEYEPTNIWEDSIPNDYNEEFLKKALIYSQRLRSQTLNTRTIEEMKSLGLFSVIQNERLKLEIDYYYWSAENQLGEKNQAKQAKLVEKWNSTFENEGLQLEGLWQDSNLTFLRNNAERAGIIYSLIRETNYVVSVCKDRLEGYEKLVEYVEAEIGEM